tara:strand:- start:16 stop:501 length:486 start_codon:yes stop_codon:yes gene_type:complete
LVNFNARVTNLLVRHIASPAFFCLITLASFSASGAEADRSVSARLVWSTMIALDNANRTGDYSIFHALGAPGFQSSYTVGSLYDRFREFRQTRTDLGRSILVEPTYYLPRTIDNQGLLRLRGGFETRPMAIRFDIVFQQVEGAWRILEIDVIEQESSKQPR